MPEVERLDMNETSPAELPANAHPPRRFDVAELLDGAGEIILVHNGADYRLRVTAANKLILTK